MNCSATLAAIRPKLLKCFKNGFTHLKTHLTIGMDMDTAQETFNSHVYTHTHNFTNIAKLVQIHTLMIVITDIIHKCPFD